MTGLLKDTFTEEAEAIGDPHLDLDAIVRTGKRRLKRRKLAKVFTSVAASAVVVAGGLTAAVHFGSDRGVEVSNSGPFAERRPTWADGKEIHFGAEVIRVPAAIASFVQTNEAFVFTTKDGGVYRVGADGATQIGKGSKNHRLAADADHSVVGWVDATRLVPEFVVYNLVADQEVVRTGAGNRYDNPQANPSLRVAAIDDGIAYFGAMDGLRRWNLATGVGELIKPKVKPTFLVAAEAGQFVWENPVDDDVDMALGSDVNAAAPAHFSGWRGTLSPGARYLLTDKADTVGVVDVRSGKNAVLTIPGYLLIAPTQWKDEHTFYAVGFRSEETARLDLLTCAIKSATKTTCQVSLSEFAPPLTNKSTTQFPIGFPMN
ncbi:hypothetical protein [Kribbella sp. NPDC051718]|uniref:hypothetical protein n=1 Tax=Kribbella sp. NPDC051718 TaxID=3155168 RepID=UPI003425F2C4